MNNAEIKIHPRKKLTGTVSSVLMAKGDHWVSEKVDSLPLTYEGIVGDFHSGLTRSSGGREPWYARGTEMRNDRQISILSLEELEDVRSSLGIEKLEAGWIGANLVVRGIERLSYVPSRTILKFDGGVSLRIDGFNGPCKFAGAEIARHLGVDVGAENIGEDGKPDYTKTELALAFKQAKMKRGLVACVEREGEIKPGEGFTALLWEQWIYE